MKANRKFQAIFFNSIFLLLGVMAVVLYKERLFADAAYYAFYLINDGWFHVEHGRLVLAVGQFIPLMGYFVGLPLKVLLVLTSLSHEIVFYVLFLLLFYGLKDSAASFLLLFVHLIGQLWLYYSPMYEITYGAAFVVLFYAILRTNKVKDDKWLILLLIAQWLAMTSHTANVLLLLFVLLFDYLENGWRKRIHTISVAFILIAALVKMLTFSASQNSNISNGLNADASLSNLLDFDYWKTLTELFVTYFPDLLIFSVIATIFLLFKKRFWQAALFVAAVLLSLFLVNYNSFTDVFNFNFENLYNPLVFLGGFAITYGVYNKLEGRYKDVMAIVFVLAILLRIYWIWDFGKPMRQRVTQMERTIGYLQTFEQSKFLINKENYEKSYSLYTGANPIEGLLFSAIVGKEKTISLISSREMDFNQDYSTKPNKNEFVFQRSEVMADDFLNERYFHLPVEEYNEVNKAVYQKPPIEMKAGIYLKPFEQNRLKFSAGDTVFLSILVQNKNKVPLPSKMPEETFLSYHWYENGENVEWDGMRTPLEVDVSHVYVQDIQLAIPQKTGNYELQLDLVIEGKMWFELPKKFEVKVNP